MVDILKYDTTFKMKGFTFEDCGHSITYMYYYKKLHFFLKNIIKNRGNFIKSITDYNNHDLDTSKPYINFSEMSKHDKSYITRFTIDFAKSSYMLEYEFLLYNAIYRYFDGELLQFPRPETFFYSKDIVHMGYVLQPNLLSDFKIEHSKPNYLSLKQILDTNKRIDITDIISIVLQVLCTLSILGDKLQFTHYNCNIDNLYVYKTNNTKSYKYLHFNIPFGDVYIPANYIILFSGLEKAHINLKYFKNSKLKDSIIQYWLNTETCSSKYSSNYDVYTFIKSIFSVLTRKDGSNYLSKRVTGPIDKRTFFSILCKNIIDETINSELTYKTPDDLIETFHEMGLSSLRLPSNRRVQIYGCGKNGEIKKTRLTHSNITQRRNNSDSDDSDNINIDNCTWKEIRNIAKEFGLKSRGKGINKAFLKRKIREEIPFYKS